MNNLKITEVKVYPFKDGPNLGHIKGIATVVLDNALQLRSLRIMDGVNGKFVGYPNDPFYKGEDFRAMYSPLPETAEGKALREAIEKAVLDKYEEAVKEG